MTNRSICSSRSLHHLISVGAVLAIAVSPPARATEVPPDRSTPSITGSITNEPVKILLGTFYHRENGCHSSASTTAITIPNAEKLDRARPGTLAGIEVVLTVNNHGSFIQQVDGDKVVVTATANGPGHWLDNPVGGLFGGRGGGGWCAGAEGADIGGQVYGWFRR